MLRLSLNGEDFIAFRCAGELALRHTAVYENAALNACEQRDQSLVARKFLAERTIPVPLPGYSIAAFLPFAALPEDVAKILYGAVIGTAFCASVALLMRLTALSATTVTVATLLPLFYYSEHTGELTTVTVFFFLLVVYAAGRQRTKLTAFAATVMLVQPHVGLPIFCAVALEHRACRPWLALGAAFIAIISVATLGVAQNILYFTTILPTHARADLARDAQFGLASFLYNFGIAAPYALRLGTLDYALMLIISIWCAHFLLQKTRDPVLSLAFVPVFIVIGGTYVHAPQFALALPAALLLFARLTQRPLNLAPWVLPCLQVVICSLAAPLFAEVNRFEAAIGTGVVAFLAFELSRRAGWRRTTACIWAATLTLLNAAGCALYLHIIFTVRQSTARIAAVMHILHNAVRPHMLADDIWRIYVDTSEHRLGLLSLPFKSPLWLAALFLATIGVHLSASKLQNRALAAGAQTMPPLKSEDGA